jgi:(S)-2-hydroxy-acid oxidase
VDMDQCVCIDDFEKEAFRVLDRNALSYYKSGADDELTLAENRKAFNR